MVPVVGTIKATVECVTGRDIISGDPVDRAERGLTAAASLAPGGSALAKTVKVASSAYDTYQTAAGAAEVVETIVEGGTPNPMDVAGVVVDVVGGKRNSGGGGRGNGQGVQAGCTHSPDGRSQRDHSQGKQGDTAPATAGSRDTGNTIGSPNIGDPNPFPGEREVVLSGPTMPHTGSGGGGDPGASFEVYRRGSSTDTNLTPRAKDKEGLSANITPPPGKSQVVDTSKLHHLEAVQDGVDHASVRPKDMSRMQEWIDSRGSGTTHEFTQELRDAITREERR